MLPTMLFIAKEISFSVPPFMYTMAHASPIPAAFEQPQTADSVPRLEVVLDVNRSDMARASSIARGETPHLFSRSRIGTVDTIPLLPDPDIDMTG